MGRRRRSYYHARDIGLERALQHIEDARRLTAELGGTDQDVKEYLFSLSRQQLGPILDAYEQKYGPKSASMLLKQSRNGERANAK